MFERLFGKKKPPDPYMPEVDESPNIEDVFAKARESANQQVVIVTPGRMLMFQACPPPGSMPQKQVTTMEQMISSQVKRNVAAIAFNEVTGLDVSRTIPFLGILIGFAYIGHSVWVFEGHSSALRAGCREADVLIVDGGMLPHLQKDWLSIASSSMRKPEIYVHDRATYSLRKAT